MLEVLGDNFVGVTILIVHFARDAQTHTLLPCTGESSKNHLGSSRTLLQFLQPGEAAWGSGVTQDWKIWRCPRKPGDLQRLWRASKRRDGKKSEPRGGEGEFLKGEKRISKGGGEQGRGWLLPASSLGNLGGSDGRSCAFGTARVFRGTGRAVKSPPASRNPPGTGSGARSCQT